MPATVAENWTVPQVAYLTGSPVWLVRLIVDRLTPPVPRVGRYRAVSPDRLEEIRAELRRRGYPRKGGQPCPAA